MRRLRHLVEYFFVRVFFCFLQTLPSKTCFWIARHISWFVSEIISFRRQVIDENLRGAFPEWSSENRRTTARVMWEHLFLMVCEIAQVPRKIHETNFRDHIKFTPGSRRTLVGLLMEPRPLTMVSGHFGNFEVGGYVTGLLGFRTFAVARPLDNPLLDDFFKRFRGAHGQSILPKHGSAKQIAAALEAGHTLVLLCDQWAGRKGCWVNFFDRPTSCHKAIAVFPLSSGAPLVVCYAKRVDRPLQFEFAAVAVADPQKGGEHFADVRSLTQWYNWRLEEMIRDTPDQYWWLHKRWKTKPPTRLRSAA